MTTKQKLYTIWTLLALPGLWIFISYLSGTMGYGRALSWSGILAAALLAITLAVTPFKRGLGPNKLTRSLMRYRRALGVAAFGYSALHLDIYIHKKRRISLIFSEALPPDLLTGWIAFFIFLALALTSNNASVKKLGTKWKRLHRLVYIAAGLTAAHWILTAFDPTKAYIFTLILGVLMLVRLRARGQ